LNRIWTEEDIIQLKYLYTKGVPFKEIGEIMDRSFSGINHKCSRLGFKRKQGKAFIREINDKEYWCICKKRKAVFIHRTIGEKMIGRKLRGKEVVHHINNNGLDNRRCNLQVMTISEHMKLHYQERELDSNGQFL